MKTSVEKMSGLARKLTIEVPADKVSSTFDRVYKGLQKNANIKGFRKGKAPMTMIRSMYADRINKDVLEDLISEAYSNALNQLELNPVTQPQVNFDKLEENQAFNFTAEFEIRPEIELKKIEKLRVEKEQMDASEEKVDSILTQIRESRADLVPIIEDRSATDNDLVEIDFVGTVDGQPLEGGTMSGYKLQLGSNTFIPGFESGIVGMKIGSKRVLNLSFPAEYHAKEIAGKPVSFDVTLKAILRKNLPELTEEFIKSLGGFESVDALREEIKKDVVEQETKRINDELKNRILRALVSENPVEVPKALLDRQKELLIEDVRKRMAEQRMNDADFEDYKNKWDKDFTETATFMIQSSFLVETIAEKEKFLPTTAELEARLQKYAKQSGIEIEKIRDFYLKNSDRRNQMSYQIMEEKVVAHLIEKADIKEVPRSKLT